MGELVPIVGGLCAGLVIGRSVQSRRGRVALMVVASVVIGIFAGVVNGELAESWAFLAIDVPGAFIAQAVVILALDRFGTQPVGERPPS